MKKITRLILLFVAIATWGNVANATNTECAGTSTEAAQGSYTLGYNYTFATVGTDVTVTFELLDTKVGLVAYAWTYNPGFAETGMTTVSGQKFTKTFTGQTIGATFNVGCKFAYAGGMSVTKTLSYTVGATCAPVVADTEAPTTFTATKGTVAFNSVELLLNASDNSGAVIYEITYGGTTLTTSSTSGVQKSYLVTGLTAATAYSFSVIAKDATGNTALNNPIVVSATTSANTNTECAGTSAEAAAGSTFTLGYEYTFTTSGTDVTATFKLLDSKVGLVAYAWTYNPNFAEAAMTAGASQSYSKTFAGQTIGSTFSMACKFAYAGGLAVTKTFTYTVGSTCGPVVADTEIPTLFTATKGTVTSSSVELLLNATDNSGAIAYTITYGATTLTTSGNSAVQKSYIVTGLTPSTAYSFSVVAKDASNNSAANNPIVVSATTSAGTPTSPPTAAPTPTKSASNVISIFSNAYTDVVGTNFNPNWGQSTAVTTEQIESNATLKYANLNYQGTQFGSDVNASTMTYLHVDVWTANETSLQIYPISHTTGEKFVALTPLNIGSWNSYNIPLVSFTTQGLSMADLFQFKFVGSGGKTVFLDNIYFYNELDNQIPTAFTATKGAVTSTSVELLLTASDNSGALVYDITYGGTTVTTTGVSAVQKSYIVTGLTASTAYSFSVTAKDASNNSAANSPIVVTATTNAALPTSPATKAPTPTKDAAKVISIFSDAYTNVAGTQFNPNWGQSTVVTTEQIESNATLKYANLNYQGTQYTTTNAFAMTHLHVDVWTANETTLQVTPISPGKEKLVTLTPLTQGVWNSYDILLSSFTNVDMANLFQFKFVGSGGKTVYLDNIYFYNNNVDVDATAPAAFTATKGAVTYNTVELLLNATDNSGAVAYDITYGGTTVSTSSASGVQKSYTVTGLSASTAYSFSVVAKDATGNAATAIVIPATTNAALSSPVTAAPTPSIDGANVVSIFSDAYTNVAGINYNPGWGQSTVYSQISVAGSSVIKLENFGYQGTTFNNINASTMTHLHLDVFTPNETSLQVTPISPGHELLVSVGALALDTWNSIIVPLSSFTGVVFSDLFQFKFVGSGGKIVYLDNVYLYNQTATSISENETNSKVICYPNPVINKTTISATSEMSQVIVRNLLGQTVKNEILNANKQTIDLCNVSAGNYFITVKLANGQSSTQKIVKL
jgi:hypothetical protein